MTEGESSPDSESEGETHEATKATCGKPRGTSHVNSTKRRGAPVHLSGDGQPPLSSSPEHMSGDGDSSEDEEYSTSSVLTAREPTPVDNSPTTVEPVGDEQSATPRLVSDISSIAQPLLPDQTLDSVDIEHEQEPESDEESETDSDLDSKRPAPTAPRRSARSTKGIPLVHYGQVQIQSTIISELEKPTRYRQTLYAPCYQLAETDKS